MISRSAISCTRLAALVLAAGLLAGGEVLAEPAAKPPEKDKAEWKSLFDGKSLEGWKATDFLNAGKVSVKDGLVLMEAGKPMTGITYAGSDFPKMDYEATFEGKKFDGRDFFCTTTFPVGDAFCSFVVGGWGGRVVGITAVDGAAAVENETMRDKEFKPEQWYTIRIRVQKDKLLCWIDDNKMVDLDTKDRKLSLHIACLRCKPFGIASYNTTGAVRNIRVRSLAK